MCSPILLALLRMLSVVFGKASLGFVFISLELAFQVMAKCFFDPHRVVPLTKGRLQ